MPTYKLTAPDGKVYHVTGNGTAEEALAQLQASLGQTQPSAPPQNSAPSAVAQPTESTGDALGRYAKEFGQGALYAGQRASAGLTGMLPRSVEQYLVSKGLSPSQEQLDASKAAVNKAGPAATIGQIGADVGLQFAPSSLITKATLPLTMGRATVANLAGQGGLNAALTPDSENRATGAAVGAGGAAMGNVLARTLGGPLRTMVSNEGKTLLDAGIPVTPGQAISGPNASGVARAIRGTEDKAGSIPILGDFLRAKARTAANAFSTGQINDALKPIGAKVAGVGHAALDDALERIGSSYDSVLPEIHVPVNRLHTLVDDAILQIRQTNPTFNQQQEEALRLYDGRRFQEFVAAGADLSGTTAKKIDQELGEYIRKFRGKNTVYDSDMAAAFTTIRDRFRSVMQGTTPEARQALRNADTARAKLQPIITAAEKNATTGEFTASALSKVISKTDKPTELQRAAAHILPETTPDSGTAGRTLLASLLTPQAAGAGAAVGAATFTGHLLPLLAGTVGAAGLYSKAGTKLLTSGAHPLAEALRKRGAMPDLTRDEAEALMRFLTSQPVRAGFNTQLGE